MIKYYQNIFSDLELKVPFNELILNVGEENISKEFRLKNIGKLKKWFHEWEPKKVF